KAARQRALRLATTIADMRDEIDTGVRTGDLCGALALASSRNFPPVNTSDRGFLPEEFHCLAGYRWQPEMLQAAHSICAADGPAAPGGGWLSPCAGGACAAVRAASWPGRAGGRSMRGPQAGRLVFRRDYGRRGGARPGLWRGGAGRAALRADGRGHRLRAGSR